MNIKDSRNSAVLKDALLEAFSFLENNQLSSLSILEVECAKGKYDAKVFLDPTGIDVEDRAAILKSLKNAKGFIKSLLLTSLTWQHIPNIKFIFDDRLEAVNKVENILKQIAQESNNNIDTKDKDNG